MKLKYSLMTLLFLFTIGITAQENASYVGTVSEMKIVPSLSSKAELIPAIPLTEEPNDGRSSKNRVVIGKDKQTQDDYFARNRNRLEQKIQGKAPSLVFDVDNNVGPFGLRKFWRGMIE